MRRLIKKRWLLFFAVVAIAFGFYFWFQTPNRTYVVSKETTYFSEPFLPDGRVDYVRALNKLVGQGVTAENNALIPLLQVINLENSGDSNYSKNLYRELGIEPVELVHELIEFDLVLENLFSIAPGNQTAIDAREGSLKKIVPWTESEHPDWSAVLEEQNTAIDIVVEASKRPRYFRPCVPDASAAKGFGDHETPEFSPFFRAVKRNLHIRAMYRLGQNEIPGAIDDLMAARRLTRLFDQSPSKWEKSISDAIEWNGLELEVYMFQSAQVNVDQLNEYLACVRLPSADDPKDILPRSLSARLNALAWITDVTLHGNRDDDPPMGGLWRTDRHLASILERCLRGSDLPTTMREINRMFDDLELALETGRQDVIDDFRSSLITRYVNIEALVVGPHHLRERVLSTPKSRARLLAEIVATTSLTWPNLEFYNESTRDTLTELAICIELFKRETGSWPDSLSDLLGKYISVVPNDLFGNGPIRYRRSVDGYVVYSVGPDTTDNNGVGSNDTDNPGLRDIRIRVGEYVK